MERMGNRVGTATKAIVGVGAAIAGSQVVGKLYDMAKAGLETASSLGEQATQLGVSTSALQRYRFIATQIGIDQAEMDKGLAKVSLTLGKLSVGTDKQRAALEKYGFTTAEVARLSKLSAEDALPFLADKYKALSSETEKAAFVAEFFGSKLGSKYKTLLEDGAAGIDKLAAAYKKLNIEISPEQIAAADAAMDAQAQNQLVLASKVAQLAAGNAENITKGTLAWEGFKVQALDALVRTLPLLEGFSDALERVDANARQFGKESGFHAFLDETGRKFTANVQATAAFLSAVANVAVKAPEYVRNMVSAIGTALTGRLTAIIDGAKAQFERVKAAAFDMWDKVTRRSYVPDMVDDIAREMARLDTVLVAPAVKATEAAKRAFEKLRDEVRPILDRLFPDVAAARQFIDDEAKIKSASKGGALPKGIDEDEAAYRLRRERAGIPVDGPGESVFDSIDPLIPAIDKIDEALGGLRRKAEVTTVAIAKTFKDMADATLASLSRLSSAIKGGGFLGILEAVIGLGLQLGSIGAFGKSIQGKINAPKVPAYAGGTMSASRGFALVGERGPELVKFNGGERVFPNGSGFGGGKLQVEVIANNNGFGAVIRNHAGQVVAESAGPLMQGGAKLAHSQSVYRQTRRVG